jgi:hypothetical protein
LTWDDEFVPIFGPENSNDDKLLDMGSDMGSGLPLATIDDDTEMPPTAGEEDTDHPKKKRRVNKKYSNLCFS